MSISGCHNAKKSFTRSHKTLRRWSQHPSEIPFSGQRNAIYATPVVNVTFIWGSQNSSGKHFREPKMPKVKPIQKTISLNRWSQCITLLLKKHIPKHQASSRCHLSFRQGLHDAWGNTFTRGQNAEQCLYGCQITMGRDSQQPEASHF